MSQVVSIRLNEGQVERLKRFARRSGKSQSEMGAQFLEEAMRESEFAKIQFRDSPIGRQAYLHNSGLAVWEVIMIAQGHDMDVDTTAAHFNRPTDWVKAAFHYYEAYPEEIDQIVEDNRSMTFDKLKLMLPNLEFFAFSNASDNSQ